VGFFHGISGKNLGENEGELLEVIFGHVVFSR
jgi:hypothetical protein